MIVKLRCLVGAGALATWLAYVGSACAQPLPALTVVTGTSPYQDALQQVMFQPFTAATGIPIRSQTWEGGIGVLRTRNESGPKDWDVVGVTADDLALGCDEGLFEKLDWSRIGGKDHYLPAGVSDCGVGAIQHAFVLSWDHDKFQGTPTWSDFWDIAKFPGKRGLRRGVRTNLEIALMADGVAPGDVYSVLRTPDGVERAFRKLDQLKPYVVWWETPAQAVQILGSGQVLMTSAPNGVISVANRVQNRHFGIQWNGSLDTVDSWAILKGTPNLDAAYRFLAFAGDPVREAQLFALIPYPGLAKGATDNLPQDLAALSPASSANTANALKIDDQFWRDNLDKLSQRFNAWLAH
jgi:putative spermidine/putrescine transport system substrate-binding protein